MDLRSPPCPPSHSPAREAAPTANALRVAYVEARPWSYRADAGLMGLDADAVRYVARMLDMPVEFVCCSDSALRPGLLSGDYDIAIGGLVQQVYDDIECVAVPQRPGDPASAKDLRSRCRQAFFPNVWWIRRGDPLWRLRLRLILLAWKFGLPRLPRFVRWGARARPAAAPRAVPPPDVAQGG